MSDCTDLEKLKRWMEEYVLDRRMGRDAAEAEEGEAVDFSGEPAPREGQIRLWPAAAGTFRPLYGLVTEDGYDTWRVLPFSPYAFPAVPEELRVRTDPPVRVVQGWNARRVSTRMASASWAVADLPGDMRFVFERWWLWVSAEQEIPGTFSGEIGPPLRHPLDPRLEYRDAERARVDAHLGEASAVYRVESRSKAAEKGETEYGSSSKPDDDPSDST